MEITSRPSPEVQEKGEILLVDKPLDWTSFDVIQRLRNCWGIRKAGHAGTLDPKATGLLIVCTGRQTKSIDQFANLEKEYTGTFQIGIQTPSFDLETEVTQRSDYSGVTFELLDSVAKRFVGRQTQTPPMYSAVKHHGKPLYEYARRGKTLDRKPKQIEIHQLSILSFAPPEASFRVVCSKGTYIRSLVSDIGAALGCGATLTALRRTRIGSFRVEDARTIEELERLKDARGLLRDVGHEHRIPA